MLLLSSLPFIATLLSLALLPLLAPRLWHLYEKHIMALLAFAGGAVLLATESTQNATQSCITVFVHDYIPFISLLVALYTLSCGLKLRLHWKPTPFHNMVFLGMGSLVSSIVGTTGASILLIAPFLHMNERRTHKIHSVIFFIFLISNIGGCLTPMGDPPLFLGYLKGVHFFWPLQVLWQPFLATWACLLIIYYGLDWFFFKKETAPVTSQGDRFFVEGKRHGIYLLLLVALIIFTGAYGQKPITQVGRHPLTEGYIWLQLGLWSLTLLSFWQTHQKNKISKTKLSFAPVKEVAIVFFVIFLTMIPVNTILENHADSPVHQIMENLEDTISHPPLLYFWLTGTFSAFLDNAPTYLIFFKIAGDDANYLMTEQSGILGAISLGAVFMGAITYIGNAPNFMVRTLAKQHGVPMPTFLGYMAWSVGILIPLLWIVVKIFL